MNMINDSEADWCNIAEEDDLVIDVESPDAVWIDVFYKGVRIKNVHEIKLLGNKAIMGERKYVTSWKEYFEEVY